MRRKTLVLIVLTVSSAVYGIAVYQSVLAYEVWKESQIRWYNEMEVFPSDARLWLDFNPYLGTFEGILAIYFGAILAFLWFLGIVSIGGLKKAKLRTQQSDDPITLFIEYGHYKAS